MELRNVARQSLATSRLLGIPSASRIYWMKARRGARRDAVVRVPLHGLPSGFWMRPKGSDLDVVLQIFFARDYDLSWCDPYQRHLQRLCDGIREAGHVPLIIDAGANIGASTLWFALNFPGVRIFAIEPDRGNFAVLEKNVEGRPNITLFNAGLWNRSTALSMAHEGGTGWACRVEEAVGGKPRVRGVTVPELLARDATLRPVIVKIDIEGAETELFRGNTDWVDDIPLIVFEAHDNLWEWLGTWQGTGHAFFSVLARRKREYLTRGENVFAFLHPEAVGPPDCVAKSGAESGAAATARQSV